MFYRFVLLPGLFGVLLTAQPGCQRFTPPTSYGLPTVAIAQPVTRQVTEYDDFTGRTEAVDSVDVRARVSGYLVKMAFKEGDEVKKGDLLFEVDPRPYQADYDKAAAQLALSQAQLKLAAAELARAKEISKTPGAISQAEMDKRVAQQAEADASVLARKADLESAKLNLDFCQITSPIDGRISRYFITLGNLVTRDQTQLTTIVSEDPIYAYFDVDERTMLNVQRSIRTGKLPEKRKGEIPVLLALANDPGYPHHGVIDFLNNKVDPFTGTISLRAVFANPKPAKGPRVFTPGLFVRIRLPLGPPHQALLVADRALATDQGQKYLLTVDDKNLAQYRRVTVGPLEEDGLRVISAGIAPADWVIVSGLQQVRPRSEVKADRVPMPVNPAPTEPKEPAKSDANGKTDKK